MTAVIMIPRHSLVGGRKFSNQKFTFRLGHHSGSFILMTPNNPENNVRDAFAENARGIGDHNYDRLTASANNVRFGDSLRFLLGSSLLSREGLSA
ncbi:hypothetical protein CEXT_4451 [Caerostris extrusa]|uniref:Uncharacterized protein n=1 Tax=Caerostris extrusa TaxID=172846 RepID=A0AAV4MYT5_CAEEX|nr:hypothetical protein CEXT_4451 [Caerostris extrusa]